MFTTIKSALTLGGLACVLSQTPAQAQTNPLDRVGIEHNVYLGCVMHIGATEGLEPLVALVEICGYNPGMSTDEFVQRYAAFAQVDVYAGPVQGMMPYRAEFTDQQFAYFERIEHILATATDAVGGDTALAREEASAVAQLRSGSRADQSVLAALSTARHSLRFWNAREQARAKRTRDDGSAQTKLRPFWAVMLVVGADLLGAAGGTLIGGPAAGAIIGAASSGGAADVLSP
jgi:hypothetical protein